MPNDIGATLKKLRIDAGFSVKEISDILISKGFKAGESTVYSWENNNSQPTPGALLTMCKAYHVSDVLSVFGYGEYHQNQSLSFSNNEIEMIKKIRLLDEHGKKVVTMLTDEEYSRCATENKKISHAAKFTADEEQEKIAARNRYGISEEKKGKIADFLTNDSQSITKR